MAFQSITLGRSSAQITCCRFCGPPKRQVGCHGWCDEYNKELEELNEANRKAHAEYRKQYDQDYVEARRDLAKKKLFKNKTRR